MIEQADFRALDARRAEERARIARQSWVERWWRIAPDEKGPVTHRRHRRKLRTVERLD